MKTLVLAWAWRKLDNSGMDTVCTYNGREWGQEVWQVAGPQGERDSSALPTVSTLCFHGPDLSPLHGGLKHILGEWDKHAPILTLPETLHVTMDGAVEYEVLHEDQKPPYIIYSPSRKKRLAAGGDLDELRAQLAELVDPPHPAPPVEVDF